MCLEVELSEILTSLPMELGGPTGHGRVGPMSQPRYTIDTTSHTLAHICTQCVRSTANFTLDN